MQKNPEMAFLTLATNLKALPGEKAFLARRRVLIACRRARTSVAAAQGAEMCLWWGAALTPATQFGTAYPVLVMVTDDVPAWAQQVLVGAGAEIIRAEKLPVAHAALFVVLPRAHVDRSTTSLARLSLRGASGLRPW